MTTSSTDGRAPAPGAPSSFWRRLLLVAVLGMVGMWVYVLYLAFGPGRSPSPDRLSDPAFAVAAEQRCGRALDEVAALPSAQEADSAEDRADVIAEANERFDALLEDLEDLVRLAPAGDDREIVREWLADWGVFVADREEYAAALRDDARAQLLVTAKDGQQVTDYINEFAKDNEMPACGSPIDA
ncbi:MAG: hypothetical protein Q8K58_03550 [Acidimicrobiales bacterium]|nr:hypothetical protein [Acidimicrobiales bacterium]